MSIDPRFLSQSNLPDGRLPTPAELFMAEEHPDEADPLVVAYLNAYPEYRTYIQAVRKAEKEAAQRALECN